MLTKKTSVAPKNSFSSGSDGNQVELHLKTKSKFEVEWEAAAKENAVKSDFFSKVSVKSPTEDWLTYVEHESTNENSFLCEDFLWSALCMGDNGGLGSLWFPKGILPVVKMQVSTQVYITQVCPLQTVFT